MMSTRSAKIVALSAGAGALIAPAAMGSSAAFAATECGSGIEVTAGICQQAFTTPGSFTFSAPTGVTKVSAVLVGAGGGASFNVDLGYAGGGGEVLFVDAVEISSPVSFTVGTGGAAGNAADGSNGTDSALGLDVASGGHGGKGDASGGSSGNGNASYYDGGLSGSGGGAGAAAATCNGGVGLAASAVAAGSSLFPVATGEPVFGAGGTCVSLGSTPAIPGNGGNAISVSVGDAGRDGAVYFRWAGAVLPDTGMSVQPWMIGAGIATVAAGALFASGVLRTRRQGRHSA